MNPTVLQECNARPVDSFSKPVAYITHNVISPSSNISGGSLSDDMQLPLQPQKGLYYFFISHIQYSPRPVIPL